MLKCVMSQNGLFFDCPHLHSLQGLFSQIFFPSLPSTVISPDTKKGPFFDATIFPAIFSPGDNHRITNAIRTLNLYACEYFDN